MIHAVAGFRGTVSAMYRLSRRTLVAVVAIVVAVAVALLIVGAPPASALDRDRSWPVGPPRPVVLRGWEPPDSAYGPGHRGVDLPAPPGTLVRAAAPGRVSFAGRVAGRGVLSLTLTGTGEPPLRTTYEPVRPLLPEGAEVSAGQVVATIEPGPSHCAAGCLHWGLLRGAEYLDPLSLLPPWLLRRSPSRLLPVFGVPPLEASVAPVAARVAAPVLAGASGTALHAALLLITVALTHRGLRRTREAGQPGPPGRRGSCGEPGPRGPAGSALHAPQGHRHCRLGDRRRVLRRADLDAAHRGVHHAL